VGSPTENWDNLMKVLGDKEKLKEKTMSERPYCSKHQRYLRSDGSCMDCDNLQLVLICAQDIVNAWPELTMRKLGEMTKRVDTLRQALEAAKK
jgi:hypothetical protein